ncbi:MAG: YjbE family putative metal transport protein [Asticcacaulis sp.]
MAGDNAVAVGLAASGLEKDKRSRAIFYGVLGAVVVRIGFVLITVELLKIVGLLFAGGPAAAVGVLEDVPRLAPSGRASHAGPAEDGGQDLLSAVTQILIADISMSLDNVLAVTGAAENHVWVLAFGLLFSIAMMGLAANLIAGILHKYRWIGYIGVVVVLFVALKMIYEGGLEIWTVGHCEKGVTVCGPYLWQGFVGWCKGLAAFAHVRI